MRQDYDWHGDGKTTVTAIYAGRSMTVMVAGNHRHTEVFDVPPKMQCQTIRTLNRKDSKAFNSLCDELEQLQ